MRSTVIAAILASGCLLGFQGSALAQGASAYPNTGPFPSTITASPLPARPGYFDQYNGYYDQSVPSVRCNGTYDYSSGTCSPRGRRLHG